MSEESNEPNADDYLNEELEISVESPIDAPGPPVIPPPLAGTPPAALESEPAPNEKRSEADGSAWHGRTPFEDLFVSDSPPLPPGRGSPEEKIGYLREKLKRSEAQQGRFKEAWSTRDREMDLLEGLFKHYWHRTTELKSEVGELTHKLAAMEDFLERKKKEISDYGEQMAQTFKKRDEMEAALREEMSARRAHDQRLIEEKQSQLAALDVKHRQLQDEHTSERASRKEQAVEQNRMLRATKDDLGKASVQLADRDQALTLAREELQEAQEAFQRDLDARNHAIEKFKDTIRKQRSTLSQGEADQTELREQLTTAESEMKQLRITHALELQQENERVGSMQEELTSLCSVRDGLDAEVESLREKYSAAKVRESGLESDKEHLENRLEKSESSISEWMGSCEDMKGQIAELQSDLSDVKQERALLQQDHERLIAAKEESDAATVSREQELRGALEKLEDQADASSASLLETQNTLAALKSEHDELLMDSKEAASALTGNIEERDDAIEKLKSSLESGRQEMSRLERDSQNIRETLEQERSLSMERRVNMVEKIGNARQVLQNAQHREGH